MLVQSMEPGGGVGPMSILESALQAGSLLVYPVAFADGLLASLTLCTFLICLGAVAGLVARLPRPGP
jgi:hypothetical protein